MQKGARPLKTTIALVEKNKGSDISSGCVTASDRSKHSSRMVKLSRSPLKGVPSKEPPASKAAPARAQGSPTTHVVSQSRTLHSLDREADLSDGINEGSSHNVFNKLRKTEVTHLDKNKFNGRSAITSLKQYADINPKHTAKEPIISAKSTLQQSVNKPKTQISFQKT